MITSTEPPTVYTYSPTKRTLVSRALRSPTKRRDVYSTTAVDNHRTIVHYHSTTVIDISSLYTTTAFAARNAYVGLYFAHHDHQYISHIAYIYIYYDTHIVIVVSISYVFIYELYYYSRQSGPDRSGVPNLTLLARTHSLIPKKTKQQQMTDDA